MKRSIAVAVIALSACATGSVGAPRTQPSVDATSRTRPPVASKVVLVVGPSTFQEIDADLAFGVMDGSAISAVERQLFEAGWDPVSRAALSKLLAGHQLAKTLRAIQDRSKATYLDAAASIVASSTADALVLVRDWHAAWSPQSAATFDKWKLCPLAAELDVAVFDRGGRLVWQGAARTRSTDILDLTLSVRSGSAETNYPEFACVTDQTCSTCSSAGLAPSRASLDRMAAHSADVLVKAFGTH